MRRSLLALVLMGCGEEPCPAGSFRADDGLCTLDPVDTGTAAVVRYSDCELDTGRFEDPLAVDATLTWSAFGQGFVRTHCASCHSSFTPNRRGAPEAVNFDEEGELVAWGPRVRIRVLEEATMPLGGGVPEADLVLLERYLCRLGVVP